jgi:hypothetical protein
MKAYSGKNTSLKKYTINMKKLVSLFWGVLLLMGEGIAQPAISGHGAYGVSNQKVISSGVLGGGVQLRYFLSSSFALGVSAKYYTEELKRVVTNKTVEASSTEVPVGMLIEYYFPKKGFFRPYVGVESGKHFLQIESAKYENSAAPWGVSPKIGAQLAIGKGFGAFVEGAYNFIAGSENSIHLDPSNPNNKNYRLKSSQQSLMGNVGLYYGLPKKVKRKKKDDWDEVLPGQINVP